MGKDEFGMRLARSLAVATLACIAVFVSWLPAVAMDEARLVPTGAKVDAKADKEFDDAMAVWFKHGYAGGQKMLTEFSKKHPDSRWTAEADLHVGCYLTYLNRLDEARTVFDNVIKAHPKDVSATKAKVRLGNVGERAGRFDYAIACYTDALKMNPTWDQFRYANYRARKLIMTKRALQARVNCGPIALAACMDALGKKAQADDVRKIMAGIDGMSLAQLKAEADNRGIAAHPVMLAVSDLKEAVLPVLAHIKPNHYVAVTGVDGDTAHLVDSITGKYDTSLEALGKIWSGIALRFGADVEDQPVALGKAGETFGGCCGQADDDECMGDQEDECRQPFSGDSCGCGNGPSFGAPTWKANMINLNLLVKDTPIWYNPGKGPQIAFTLTYSNENSNTGIFGKGWRSPYDMKVFFLPSGDEDHPGLQVHRANGRIETYEWTGSQYLGRQSMRSYGYQDKLEFVNDVPILTLKGGGGKYYFVQEGSVAEGRIQYIEDSTGNRVECTYSQAGTLTGVIDANGMGLQDPSDYTTIVYTEGTGIDERVISLLIPDGRVASFEYDDGFLTSITDMGGYPSTLSYNALAWGGQWSALLDQGMTASPLSPANGEGLKVRQEAYENWEGTEGFPPSGAIQVTNSDNPPQQETITYTGKALDRFLGITRGSSPIDASSGAIISSVGTSYVPYLSTIETPSRTTMFTYEWWSLLMTERPVVALHEVYECAAGEDYPLLPTIHYAWCSAPLAARTSETRYPKTLDAGQPGCYHHWTGGLTRVYCGYPGPDDATGSISDLVFPDTEGPVVVYPIVAYDEYSENRDPTKIRDGNGNPTVLEYDGNHNVISRIDPMTNTWTYGYEDDRLVLEQDPKGRNAKIYTYNIFGQITKIETALTPGTLAENWYYTTDDSLPAQDGHFVHTDDASLNGKLQHSLDGLEKSTIYVYNASPETRGFLTSIEDPLHHSTSYYYDTKGRRYQVTDALNHTTTYTFDNLDRVVTVTNPDNATIETEYTCCHQDKVTDENGIVTKYEYDKRNRLWAVIKAAKDTTLGSAVDSDDTVLPLTVTTGFPASGTALLKTSTGDTEIVTYTGISNSALIGVSRGQFGTTAKAFTTAGVTEGNMTVNVYDEDVLDGNGGYTHRGILDRMIGLYDPNGHLTQYEYNDNNRVKKTIYADGTWEQYTYDGAGNMIRKEYGHSTVVTKTINYKYDPNNRLVSTY